MFFRKEKLKVVYLKEFTKSLKGASDITPTVERWLYGTRELEKELSERIISLCRYFERIPEQSLPNYADLLLEALNNEDLGDNFLSTEQLDKQILVFLDNLESTGDEAKGKKAELIRGVVHRRFQSDE